MHIVRRVHGGSTLQENFDSHSEETSFIGCTLITDLGCVLRENHIHNRIHIPHTRSTPVPHPCHTLCTFCTFYTFYTFRMFHTSHTLLLWCGVTQCINYTWHCVKVFSRSRVSDVVFLRVKGFLSYSLILRCRPPDVLTGPQTFFSPVIFHLPSVGV